MRTIPREWGFYQSFLIYCLLFYCWQLFLPTRQHQYIPQAQKAGNTIPLTVNTPERSAVGIKYFSKIGKNRNNLVFVPVPYVYHPQSRRLKRNVCYTEIMV